ncbi:MAG: gliding motility-associated C-terminal domain-containing protein, partial [Bacteroidota bacterium]
AGAGTHTITYSVDNGTCTTVDTEDIVVNPSPDTTIAGNIAVCVNSTETYTVPAGETTYAWVLTGGDGSISSGAGTNSITIDWISAGGDLSVTITGAAPSSCVSSSTITVGVYSTLPAMPDESINACQNSGVYPTLTATPDPGAIVSWYIGPSDTGTLVGTGDTFTPTSAELDLSIVATTTFTYIQDIGCLRSLDAAYDVIVIPGPDAGIDSAALTCSSYAPFDLTTKLGGTPLLGGTWTWDDDNGTGALSGSIFNPALCGDGTYNFTYEVNGAGACTGIFDTSSLELTVSSTSPDPVVNQVIYEGCTYTDPPELSAVGGGIIWYSDAALSNAVGTGENFTPTDGSDILMNIIGTTSFYVTQNEGCGESAGVQVDVILEGAEAEIGEVINTYPEQDIGSIEVLNMISSTDSIPFDASLLDGADSTIIYDWQTVEENRLGEHIHLFALLPEGNYIVQVRDANGCIFPIAQPITYKTDLFIPNVFTPNNDDYNEYFKILNKPDNTKILITNRWGIKVFESDDYQNDWNAEGLPEGVYFYTIQTGGKVYRGNVEVWRNAGPSQYKY